MVLCDIEREEVDFISYNRGLVPVKNTSTDDKLDKIEFVEEL